MYFLLPLLKPCPLRGHPSARVREMRRYGAHGYGPCKLRTYVTGHADSTNVHGRVGVKENQ